jgi:alcohol dehydrogenase
MDDLPQKCERLYKYGHERLDAERPRGGGLADFVLLAPGTTCLRVPDAIPDAVAASANCATATAAAALRQCGPIQGKFVLVLGAGMLGVTACAMARVAGAALVIASDPSAARRERALRFGATHIADIDTNLPACVRELTQGRGAHAVLELAGAADSVRSALSLAGVGGTIVLAGTVAPVGCIDLDPENMVRRLLTIRGVHNYHPRDLMTALAFLAGPGREFPWQSLVADQFALEQAEQAFAAAHAQPGMRVAVLPNEEAHP